MIAPFSVIIPVRDEAVALGRTAPALKYAIGDLPAEIIYVLNATSDRSAAVIRKVFGDGVQIIQMPHPGKTAALNAGDHLARAGAHFYLDADVVVDPELFQRLLAPLQDGTADLVAPRLYVSFEASGAVARRVGRVWADQMMRRPDAFMGCTGFSLRGQHQRGPWPDVLADDDWARGRIDPARRTVVEAARVHITAPGTLYGWINVRARWVRGTRELKRLGIQGVAPARVPPRGALLDIASYYVVRIVAEPIAVLQNLIGITWGRDESSRK